METVWVNPRDQKNDNRKTEFTVFIDTNEETMVSTLEDSVTQLKGQIETNILQINTIMLENSAVKTEKRQLKRQVRSSRNLLTRKRLQFKRN